MNREAFYIPLQPPNIQVETKPLRRPECKVKAQSVSVCLYFHSLEPLYSSSATEKCILSHSVSTTTTLDSDCPECGSLLVSEQSVCTSYLYTVQMCTSRNAVQCVCVCPSPWSQGHLCQCTVSCFGCLFLAPTSFKQFRPITIPLPHCRRLQQPAGQLHFSDYNDQYQPKTP